MIESSLSRPKNLFSKVKETIKNQIKRELDKDNVSDISLIDRCAGDVCNEVHEIYQKQIINDLVAVSQKKDQQFVDFINHQIFRCDQQIKGKKRKDNFAEFAIMDGKKRIYEVLLQDYKSQIVEVDRKNITTRILNEVDSL